MNFNIYDILTKRGKGNLKHTSNVLRGWEKGITGVMTERQFNDSIEYLNKLDLIKIKVNTVCKLYNVTISQKAPEIYVYIGLAMFLLETGLKTREVAYLLGKERSTISSLMKRREMSLNDRIGRLIINDVLENCRIRIND